MKKKIKMLMICYLFLIVLCLEESECSAKVKEQFMIPNKSCKKYDVTGDGKTDTVRLTQKPVSSGFNEVYDWKIKINGKTVYSIDWTHNSTVSVTLYEANENQTYVYIKAKEDWCNEIWECGLFQYKKGKLKKVVDFMENVELAVGIRQDYNSGIEIEKMTSKEMIVSYVFWQDESTWSEWKAFYTKRGSKWKKTYMVENKYITYNDLTSSKLYQFKNGKKKLAVDFIDGLGTQLSCSGTVDFEKMTANKIVVTCIAQLRATAHIEYKVNCIKKGNKWKKQNMCKTTEPDKIWTTNRKIKVYTKPNSKKKAFTLKKGTQVKIKKICVKKNSIYLQVTKKNGKKGWIKNPKTFISGTGFEKNGEWYSGDGYFYEARFAG